MASMVKHMVLFMCTRIIIPESKNKCVEIVIESKNDDLLTKVPIGLEISEEAPCCGDSWCTEILVEIGVPATVELQMETKQCKFYVVGKRVFPLKRYKRERERVYEWEGLWFLNCRRHIIIWISHHRMMRWLIVFLLSNGGLLESLTRKSIISCADHMSPFPE